MRPDHPEFPPIQGIQAPNPLSSRGPEQLDVVPLDQVVKVPLSLAGGLQEDEIMKYSGGVAHDGLFGYLHTSNMPDVGDFDMGDFDMGDFVYQELVRSLSVAVT
ncbi:MAG: hypothetical protein U1C97_00420 [Candidatus Gracilibacteria bacterium]|nr:hypothetical protein [Candidatus Gracilibacteria bacterium]